MNAKNHNLFFNEDSEEEAIITLTDEDGISVDAEIILAIEIEEFNKEYVAALPTEPNSMFEEDEIILMIYSEDDDGNPEFSPIEDEEELEFVGAALEQILEEEEEEDDDEYDVSEENYLDDISDLFPGISIKND